jgi:hypothetical protein
MEVVLGDVCRLPVGACKQNYEGIKSERRRDEDGG